MPLYDFACECGVVIEGRQGYDVTAIPCPRCGKSARRLATYANQHLIGDTVAKGRSRAGRAVGK